MSLFRKKLSIVLSIMLLIVSFSGIGVFAGENGITIHGSNGDATQIETGTSMKMEASGVSQGKSVVWSVKGLDGAATSLAVITQTGALTAILTASTEEYGTFKVVAAQKDNPGKSGEQVIQITKENLITVDDKDASIHYEGAGSGEEWETTYSSDYCEGTGTSVVVPEDDSYSYDEPAYAEFTFTGTGIQWIGEANTCCGAAEVYLDGTKVSTVDPFIAPAILSQSVNFSAEGLQYGQHTIKIVATGMKNPASTVYPGTRVLVDAFRYITGSPIQEPTGPAVILSGPDRVLPGETFPLGVGLYHVDQDVYAERIVMNYDADVFEYVSAEGISSDIQIVTEDIAEPGIIKLIAANLEGITGENMQVLKLTFRAKTGIQHALGNIAVTKAELGIAPEGTVITAGLSSKQISVGDTELVDKSVLSAAVTSAEAIYAEAQIGGQPGQYPSEVKAALRTALDQALLILHDSAADQGEIDNAVAALRKAVDDFRASAVTEGPSDLNADGSIDVLDLAIVAYYYGYNSYSEDWAKAKTADVNHDDQIDVSDLAYIASRLLNQ